jgi:antitoxin PrlF
VSANHSPRDFELEGDTIRVRLCKSIARSHAKDGFGLLRCELPGERRLSDFDVAKAMQDQDDDRT